VSLSAVKVLLLCARATADPAARAALLAKAAPPLVTLLAAEPELQYVALRNIQLVAALHPECLQHEVRQRGGRGCGGCVRARARPSSPHAPLPLPCRSAPFSSSTTTPPTSKRRSWTCWWRWRRRRRSTRCSPSSKVRGAKRRGEEARGGGRGCHAGRHAPAGRPPRRPRPAGGRASGVGREKEKKKTNLTPFPPSLPPPIPQSTRPRSTSTLPAKPCAAWAPWPSRSTPPRNAACRPSSTSSARGRRTSSRKPSPSCATSCAGTQGGTRACSGTCATAWTRWTNPR